MSDNVVSFTPKVKDEWTAVAALQHALSQVNPSDKAIVIYVNSDGVQNWSSAGFTNHELLWTLENTKFSLLTGDY